MTLTQFEASLTATSSSRPCCRAFSSGGVDQRGNPVTQDPRTTSVSNAASPESPRLDAFGLAFGR